MNVRIAELLNQLNTMQEGSRIEAKTSIQLGRSVLETICAFTNEPNLGGGYLVLGVAPAEDENAPYQVIGVPDADQLQADVASQCATAFNRLIRSQVWTEVIDGKKVVGMFVPEGQPHEKPFFLKSLDLPRGAMRRVGSTDQHCTEDDMLVFYQDRGYHSLDETVVSGTDLHDLDPGVIDDYRQYRTEANAAAEELRWSNEDLLYALGCVEKRGEHVVPTIAGVLLFGTDIAIRRHFPMMRVDYIQVPGKEWVRDPEQRFATVEFRGPLLRLIPRIHAAVVSDIPKQFSLPVGNTQRVDVPLIPDRVMREAIVNAVMHRSYRIHGATQIIRYSNRLEIRNPGHSLVAEDHLGEPGSKTRNPKIAAVLHETRFAETKGSGIRVMREMMSVANLSPPTFESDHGRDQFIATFLFHHFLDPGDMAWLAQFRDYDLSDDEAKALVFVREVGGINELIYRHLNEVPGLYPRQRLQRLQRLGLLDKRGQGSREYFRATALLQTAVDVAVPANSLSPASEGPNLGVQTPETIDLPLRTGLLSPRLRGIPEELAAEVEQLGERPTPRQVRQVIRHLCAWQPLPAAKLAEILNRRRDYLQTAYLRPMVVEGELQYTVSDRPASPKQAYRTVSKRQPS